MYSEQLKTMRIERKKSPQPTANAIMRVEYFTCMKESTTRLVLVKAIWRSDDWVPDANSRNITQGSLTAESECR